MIDFTKIFQLKGLKPKNKGQTNFFECCDLTKKVYLVHLPKDICESFFVMMVRVVGVVRIFTRHHLFGPHGLW